mmetsp:Transcript_46235/g.145009  ORF Transcript_46235/g.145009 Transcript_46235/m.145009 type:complete len:223 (+) Transcript_46235:353-1021(+)
MTHNKKRKQLVTILLTSDPPISAPKANLLPKMTTNEAMLRMAKIRTLKPRDPASTTNAPVFSYCWNLLHFWYFNLHWSSGPVTAHLTAAHSQGMPRPRKTLTQLLPVTFPSALSAVSSILIAIMEAKVSGNEVPRATMVMAVTGFSSPTRQPKMEARSPTMAVTQPIRPRATKKQYHPPPRLGGGIKAATNCQGQVRMKMQISLTDALDQSPSSLTWKARTN